VCTPKSPDCAGCPVSTECRAFKKGTPGRYPILAARTKSKIHYQVCTVIERNGKVLLVRDRNGRWYKELRRLPFFETPSLRLNRKALCRRIKEEFGLEVEIGRKMLSNEFVVTHHKVTQLVVHCRVTGGRVLPRPGRRCEWVRPGTLNRVPLPASQKIITGHLSVDHSGSMT
jgi:A/G-specific adenine glycosylase